MFFDGTNDDENILNEFGQMPDGTYRVCVANMQKVFSQKNSEIGMTKVEFEVIEGNFRGRKIFQYFIGKHPTSEMAVKLGRAKMKSLVICATGDCKLENPEQIYGKPIVLRMRNKTQKDGRSSFEIESIHKDDDSAIVKSKGGSFDDIPF